MKLHASLTVIACTAVLFSGCGEQQAEKREVPVDGATAEPPSRGGNMVEYEQSGGRYRVLDTSEGYDERGVASWYGEAFQGRPTSSGEPVDMNVPSAAHRTLPLPAWVRVTNLGNGRSVLLRVNDRGPFADTDRRIIDVSYAAAVQLGMVETGTASVDRLGMTCTTSSSTAASLRSASGLRTTMGIRSSPSRY